MLIYRDATLDDLKAVSCFTDFWLSGRGKRLGISGAVDDCFISPSQHKKYICKYRTLICFCEVALVGWAVVEPSGTLIHMLVSGYHRGKGIGKQMMRILLPKYVRSKLDQSSGDPRSFYEKLGYYLVRTEQSRSRLDIDVVKPKRKANIDILQRSV